MPFLGPCGPRVKLIYSISKSKGERGGSGWIECFSLLLRFNFRMQLELLCAGKDEYASIARHYPVGYSGRDWLPIEYFACALSNDHGFVCRSDILSAV